MAQGSLEIFLPLEDLARWLKFGELRTRAIIRDSQIVRLSVQLGPDVEKSWTLEDVRLGRVKVVE